MTSTDCQISIRCSSRSTYLQQRYQIRVRIRKLHPTINQRRHKDIQVQGSAERRAHRVRKCSKRVVEDKQILLLVFVEGESEVSQNRLKERHKLGTSLLFEGSEGGTSGLLHSLVSVKNHLKELDISWVDKVYGRLTPSIVGMKYLLLSSGNALTHQLEYRPNVQHVIDRTKACVVSICSRDSEIC